MRAILALFYYIVVFTIMVVAGIPYTLYCGIRGHWEKCTNVCYYSFKYVIFKLFGIKVSVKGAEKHPAGHKLRHRSKPPELFGHQRDLALHHDSFVHG